MLELYKNIKNRRKELKMSQEKLAELVGYTDRSSIAKVEKGEVDLPQSKIVLFAKALNIEPGELLGDQKNPNIIPVLGRVAAGIPIEAVEEIIDYEEIDSKLASTGEFFGLKIKGDSMTPRICDGDVVIVRKQEAADPGDIVIATINGDDAVCKKLQIFGKAVLLYSLNPSYEPIDVTGREDFKIIGKVIELRGKF
jgi:repressor LexA